MAQATMWQSMGTAAAMSQPSMASKVLLAPPSPSRMHLVPLKFLTKWLATSLLATHSSTLSPTAAAMCKLSKTLLNIANSEH